MSCMFDSLHVS